MPENPTTQTAVNLLLSAVTAGDPPALPATLDPGTGDAGPRLKATGVEVR